LYHDSNDEQKKLTIKTNYFSVVRLTEKLIPFLSDDGKVLQVWSLFGQLRIQGETLRNALSDAHLTESKLNGIANNIINLTSDYKPWGPADESSYPASKALLNAYVKNFLPAKFKANQQAKVVKLTSLLMI